MKKSWAPHASDHIKIAVTFFVLYSIFTHSVGWNEQTRTLAAISIVDENRLDMNKLANFTGDRISYGGNYYSDKPPGVAFFSLPVYSLSKLLTNDTYDSFMPGHSSIPQPQFNTTVYFDQSPGPAFLSTIAISTILLAALPGALSVVLIYKILACLGFDGKTSAIVSAMFGAGTILFSYSTVLVGNTMSTMLALASVLIYLKGGGKNKLFLCGCLLGIAAMVDYLSIIFSAAFVAWILLSDSKARNATAVLYLALGALFALMPFFIYNLSIFGSPLAIYGNYIDPAVFPCAYGKTLLSVCRYNQFWGPQESYSVMPELLIRPYKGVFFYMPFLFISFAGIWHMRKSAPALAALVASVFALYVVAISSYPFWIGGSTFGLRYMLMPIALMSIPTAYFFQSNKSRLLWSAMLVLFALSAFHMVLGASAFWEGATMYHFETYTTYIFRWYGGTTQMNISVSDNELAVNPLYGHYLPAFLDEGPRSRLMEGLLKGAVPDIRDSANIYPKEIRLLSSPLGIVTLEVPFLIVPIVLFMLAAIWFEELSKMYTFGKPLILSTVLILSILVMLSRLGVSKNVFDDGWLPAAESDGARWISKDAKIYAFSEEATEKYLNMSFQNYRSNNLEIYLNGDIIGSYAGAGSVLERVNMQKGENVMELRSADGCMTPLYEENQLACSSTVDCYEKNMSIFEFTYDSRCLGFEIKNIEILNENELGNSSYYYGNNWYQPENASSDKGGTFRQMSQDATILLPRANKTAKFNISIDSFSGPDILDMYIDDVCVGSYDVNNFFHTAITPALDLNRAVTILRMHSRKGCVIPEENNNSSDLRCTSFAVQNISEISVSDMIRQGKTLIFTKGWFERSHDGNWSSNKSEISLLSDKSGMSAITISIIGYNTQKLLQVYANGNEVGSYVIGNEPRVVSTDYFYINEGENVVRFFTSGCETPMEIEGTDDIRCLGFRLDDIKFSTMPFEYESSFSEEHLNETQSIGIGTLGKLYFSNEDAGIRRLRFDYWGVDQQRKAELYLDGTLMTAIATADSNGHLESPLVYLREGQHTLEFHLDDCSHVLNGDMCLGMVIGNFSNMAASDLLENINQNSDKGWYELELDSASRKFRWSNGDATLLFFNPQQAAVSLNFSGSAWSYYIPRTVSMQLNDSSLFDTHFETRLSDESNFNIALNLAPGKNELALVSSMCGVPYELEMSDDKRCLSVAFVNLESRHTP